MCADPTVRHNVSNTVTVPASQWNKVEDYLFKNKEYFAGVSFLSGSGDKDYHQAPMTEVLEEDEIVAKYGRGAMFAAGLIVDTRKGFNEIMNNLEDIEACAHITGGGITGNLPRALEGLSYHLEVSLDPYWKEVQSRTKLTWDEMMSTFNCGFGMLILSKKPVLNISDSYLIGEVLSEEDYGLR